MSANPTRRVLLIGGLEATRLTCELLGSSGASVDHLLAPTEREVTDSLRHHVDIVVIIVHSDIQALRYALLAAHCQPRVSIITTVFDATVAAQLIAVVPNCVATSPADIAVPSIVGTLLDDDAVALRGTANGPALVVQAPGTDELIDIPWVPPKRRWALAEQYLPRWYAGSLSLMFSGLIGLAVILLTDWALSMAVLHESLPHALYGATSIVTAVGPADADVHDPPTWYLLLSVLFMLAALVFTGTFIAGLVDWLMSTRSVRSFGKLALPRRDHVIVAGLGQVGLRTCLALNRLSIPVVAIERDPDAENLRLARNAGIPVLIGHAEDRGTLDRVRLPRARALAALGSDELDNVTIAISALAIAPDTRLVLRAGEDRVVAETQSLFRIGRVINVSAQTAMLATLQSEGRRPSLTFGNDGLSYAAVATPEGTDLIARHPSRCRCGDL